MLREYFPNTNQGAEMYGGFLHHQNCFCKVFDMKETLTKSIKEINEFLEINGYEASKSENFDETNTYKSEPVTIAPHGYKEQFVLFIERDVAAKSQLDFLINELKRFRDDRDWGQFHNPKDLSIAISIEANELLEQFLWKSFADANIDKIKEELADVFSFSLLLAEKYNLDIEEIVLDKIKQNAEKYPIEKAKGTAKKYNEL
ncbi:MAG: nucleotide pyrophosphohydrolase [Bacteroidia bacterium]